MGWIKPSSAQEIQRLKNENQALCQLQAETQHELELLRGVTEVAELQRSYAIRQMDEQQHLYKLWMDNNKTVDVIRHAVANSSEQLDHQHDTLSESL